MGMDEMENSTSQSSSATPTKNHANVSIRKILDKEGRIVAVLVGLKGLEAGNVQGLSDGESEGRRMISWIWLVSYGPAAGGDEDQMNEGTHLP